MSLAPRDDTVDSSPGDMSRLTERQRAKEAADRNTRLAAEVASEAGPPLKGKKVGITYFYELSPPMFVRSHPGL